MMMGIAPLTNAGIGLFSTRSLSRAGSLRRQRSSCSLVTVILVGAKGLPDVPTDGTTHGLYCKLRLGSQSQKSKTVAPEKPEWRERFEFSNYYRDVLLTITLWDKGKQKNFMGNCTIDLTELEKEKTIEIRKALDDGYGSIHLSVTICNVRKPEVVQEEISEIAPKDKFNILNLSDDWDAVGELHVKVLAAKGLSGRPNAYCSLELGNEKVRTHSASASSEPAWNQNFIFTVRDITSILELKVCDNSLVTALRGDCLGRVAIPLLRVQNGEQKWYALKDKTKRSIAKGNCPRVLLEMDIRWNPIKASLKLFRPKEVKYIKKSQKFDIALIYKNIEFIKDTFVLLVDTNEAFKQFLEWDNMEYSSVVLAGWLMFWYNFRPWAMPLLLLIPFFSFWISSRHQQERSFMRNYGVVEETGSKNGEKDLPEKKLTNRIQEIPEMTLTITDGIQYLASLAEKMYNLASFKVPYLSYLTMVLLVIASAGLYFIDFNYIMMIFGIYKFTRKYLDPNRKLNNDLVDFISRIPDTDELNEWKELSVPEPTPRVARSSRITSATDENSTPPSSPR